MSALGRQLYNQMLLDVYQILLSCCPTVVLDCNA